LPFIIYNTAKTQISRLFFPAAIPNLAPVIFCKPVKDQKPVLKTEQIHPQQNPALPDFPRQNTARTEMNFRMPGVDNDYGDRNYCGGLDEMQRHYTF